MGCVSSKLFREELRQTDIIVKHGSRHVVSLTSTTYGALDLEIKEKHSKKEQELQQKNKDEQEEEIKSDSPVRVEPEVINTWELMGDLEEVVPVSNPNPNPNPIRNSSKKSPKTRALFADMDARTPLKFLNQFGSPRKARTFGGKENKVRRASDFSPRPVIKPGKSSKAVARLSYPAKEPAKSDSIDSSGGSTSSRRSFSPFFDPELLDLYEKELTSEQEQIKKVISLTPNTRKAKNSESILSSYEQICPPGGEKAVVIYTTTLRGIRKTFEDCNAVQSIIESHHVHVIERDVSMDSGLKEELRGLMGTKEVKVPQVFVKGRLVGGAEEVARLDEEGKLGVLFEGIERRTGGGCEGCAGIRFVMCMECNGSCKVMDLVLKKMVKCGECNENGLIQCPICC